LRSGLYPKEGGEVRYARGHKEEARARLLDAMGRGFRRQGYGVGVNDLAKEAGVTSGALYGHFRSKAEAFREALALGLDGLRAGIEAYRATHGARWGEAFAAFYLGAAHRRDIAGGCALPSLSAEVGRADEAARGTYEAAMLRVAGTIADGLPSGSEEQRRRAAWEMLALLAGGTIIARGVLDEAVAEEIASAIRGAVGRVAASEPLTYEAGVGEPV